MSGDTGGNFTALLEEIGEDLTKSLAGEGTESGASTEPGAAGEGEVEGGAGEDDLGKSFKLKLEDGSEVEAVDGAALVKALVGRIEGNEAATLKVVGEMAKALQSQGALIKSLTEQVGKLGNEGKGRKAIISISEKPAPKAEELTKSQTEGQISGDEFMAKALLAQGKGLINGAQVAIAEAHINNGKAPPRDIVATVMAAAQ